MTRYVQSRLLQNCCMRERVNRAVNKERYASSKILILSANPMLWVLKRILWMRRFLWVSQHFDWLDNKRDIVGKRAVFCKPLLTSTFRNTNQKDQTIIEQTGLNIIVLSWDYGNHHYWYIEIELIGITSFCTTMISYNSEQKLFESFKNFSTSSIYVFRSLS